MPWTTLMILAPFVASLFVVALPPQIGAMPMRAMAMVGTLVALAANCYILAGFDRDGAELQFVDTQEWATQVGLEWNVGVDGISIWLVLLTTVLFTLAIIATMLRPPWREPQFLMLLLMGETAMLGLFTANNLVLFYVFWEAMLIPFAFMIGIWGNEDRREAVMRFVVYTMVGSLVMLVAVVGTAFVARDVTGQFTYDIQALRGVEFTETQSTLLFAGFALAFAIKLPLFPFHGWLPRAYGAAPLLVTALLAAVMSKAAVYGLLRVGVPIFPDGAENFTIPLLTLAVIGIIYGSLVAWRQDSMRMLIAYSSLAHLGFIVLGIMAFDVIGVQGAVLQMVNHGIVVAASFAIVAVISRAADHEMIDSVSGLSAVAPRMAYVFLLVAMAALAIPGSNAFVGECVILTGTFRWHVWAASLATIGIVYAAVYMLRLYQGSFMGPLRAAGRASDAELTVKDAVYMAPLVLAMLFIAFYPAALVGATEASVSRAVAPAQIAADRPPEDIAEPVVPNPPPVVQPLPGDEPDPAAQETGAPPQ